jgi:hypothetical protein
MAGVLCGCAARPATTGITLAKPVYMESCASALAFTPPIAYGQGPVVLPRDVREPAAFVGFEDLSATYFYTRTDDRQNLSADGWSYRRAVSEKVGVSYR